MCEQGQLSFLSGCQSCSYDDSRALMPEQGSREEKLSGVVCRLVLWGRKEKEGDAQYHQPIPRHVNKQT